MPTRIQGGRRPLGEIAHKGKSDRPLASRSQPSATSNANFTALPAYAANGGDYSMVDEAAKP